MYKLFEPYADKTAPDDFMIVPSSDGPAFLRAYWCRVRWLLHSQHPYAKVYSCQNFWDINPGQPWNWVVDCAIWEVFSAAYYAEAV